MAHTHTAETLWHRGGQAFTDQRYSRLHTLRLVWFLSIAAREGFVVDSYHDKAVGLMQPNERGRLWLARVALRSHVFFLGRPPHPDEIPRMHHEAHDECYIANSVKTVRKVLPGH